MARRTPTTLPARTAASQPLRGASVLEADSLTLIEQTLGGRAAVVAAISHAPKSRDIEYLLGLIGDPAHADIPLADLCTQGGITPGELLAAWRSGEILRGHVIATRKITEGLPAIVDDVVKRAAPYEDICASCSGVGQVTPEPTKKIPNPEPGNCPACAGSGRLLYPPDFDRVKLALDLAQLTPKAGGISVQVDARQAHLHSGGGGAAGGTLDALMAASDQLLYGQGSGVDLRGPLLEAPGATSDPPAVLDAELVSSADSADPEEAV